MARQDDAASKANSEMLFHPAKAPIVVRLSNQVATAVLQLAKDSESNATATM